jgi:membrane protein implicated in regulation of membrane protease activity
MQNLLAWWNLIFLIPFTLAIVLMVVSAFSGFDDGDGDSDGEADSGGDEGDGEGHEGITHGDAHSILHTIGFGAIPVTLLLQFLCLAFGVLGFAVNQFLRVSDAPGSRFPISLLIAVVGALIVAAIMASVARRFMPTFHPATGNKDLVGRTGKVIFAVTDSEGTVQVRDAGGTVHQIAARIRQGRESLASGAEVLLVGYDSEQGAFIIEESPFA